MTMSLTCGQTRRQIRGLRQLSRRYEHYVNTVIIYVVEPHPIDAPSPYADMIWVTTKNEMAGILVLSREPLKRALNCAPTEAPFSPIEFYPDRHFG